MIKCMECGFETNRLQWTHFKYKCNGNIVSIKEYREKYPDALTVCPELAKTTAVTKKKMVEKYGEVEGLKRWKSYKSKQAHSNTYEYKKTTHGWDKTQYDQYNKSRAVTRKNLIERHGDIEGLIKWEEYCERQRYTNTLEYFIEKYGESDGEKKWLEYNKEKSKGHDPYYVAKEYNLSFDEAVELISSRKYMDFVSESEKAFVDKLETGLGYSVKYSYKTKQFSIWSHDLETIVFYDACDNLTKTIYEFHGDFWHCNPNKYESEYIHPIRNMTAREIWERDRLKMKAAFLRGFKVVVVWESEFNKGDESWKKILNG